MTTPLVEMLIRHEGLRTLPYTDTVGKLTIGVGRNLDDLGITKDEALYLLNNDLERCRCELNKHCPWWLQMDEVRQAVLLNMCFNLGINRLLGFNLTLGYLRNQLYGKAAEEVLKSKWAEQVGKRATELSEMMRSGQWPVWLSR